ncbi:hypothetical protein DFH07DRAFT_772070 [Mycena maculata]|uniref:Uncharacterized protein n=1 Tax=Mycena maculata TaxID=230809 RepID=A0AAD7NGC7_9AGAR|nr:hypothetical protein DFH07DRAFT_772070 [Mycena maculata]
MASQVPIFPLRAARKSGTRILVKSQELQEQKRESELKVLRQENMRLQAENLRLTKAHDAAVEDREQAGKHIMALQSEVDVSRQNAAKVEKLRTADPHRKLNKPRNESEMQQENALVSWERERVTLEEVATAKDSELRALRDENEALGGALRQELDVATSATAALAAENVDLKETLRRQQLQISDLEKAVLSWKQSVQRLQATEAARLRLIEIMREKYLDLESAHNHLTYKLAARTVEREALAEAVAPETRLRETVKLRGERSRCLDYMKKWPDPFGRPVFDSPELSPIADVGADR